MLSKTKKVGRLKQSGATAVEFALVFPALFAIAYGGITYGFIFFLQQQVNFAAQEGLRSAIAVDPANVSSAAYFGAVQTAATNTVLQNFTPTASPGNASPVASTHLMTPNVTMPTPGIVTVTVRYSLLSPEPFFPSIDLPFIGPIPNVVGGVLVATATGRLS